MCVAHIDYACSLFNKCENGVLKMYVVFAILLMRFLKRHIAISKNKSSLSFIPDRPTILHISATYKMVGTVSGDPPQGRNLRRHIAARSEQSAATRRLVAVFVGDEDYFYSVLVTLMSHYDIIVANPVGT